MSTQSNPGRAFNGNRLYRNPRNGLIFGVCAGLADYFGFDVTITRVVVVLAAFGFAPMVLTAYLLLALLLPKAPEEMGGEDDPHALERRIRTEPHGALDSVRHRYRELDVRLQRLETYVTSERFQLDREFDKLRD
jgi:phage shock protein C